MSSSRKGRKLPYRIAAEVLGSVPQSVPGLRELIIRAVAAANEGQVFNETFQVDGQLLFVRLVHNDGKPESIEMGRDWIDLLSPEAVAELKANSVPVNSQERWFGIILISD